MRPDKCHLIGHSLGAYIAGYSGERLTDNDKIGRITGLDPEEPCFQCVQNTDTVIVIFNNQIMILFNLPKTVRLDRSDA